MEKAVPASPKPIESAGLESVAKAIRETTARNVAVSSAPASSLGGWRDEPATNFELDGEGRVKLRHGKPIRRGGRPRKLLPGDRKAGELEAIEVGPSSSGGGAGARATDNTVSVPPDDPDSVVRLPGDTGRPGASPQAGISPAAEEGEPICEVLADGIFAAGESAIGPEARPTQAERDTVQKYARRATGGLVIDPWVALLAAIGVYALRLWLQLRSKRSKTNSTETPPSADSPGHHRSDDERQEPAGQVDFFSRP